METTIATPAAKPSWYRRHWVHLALAFTLGGAIGMSSAGSASPGVEQIAAAEERATTAEAALANSQAALDAEQSRLETLKAELAARESKISTAEKVAAENTIPGEGVFLVGTDIKPGTYRGNVDGGQCYFARLGSADTSDILDNGNFTGPVVVTIKRSDKAFQTTGCGEWKKIS